MHPFIAHIRTGVMAAMLIALAGCQTIQFERPQVLSEADWPTDGRTEERSRHIAEEMNLPLELAWEYSANAGFGSSSPLVLQDRVLVGNRKGEVHAVELETGRGRGFKQLGESVEGSPLIHEGIMFVPVAWGKHVLVAFDLAKGTNLWRNRGIPFSTTLVGHEETVIGIDIEGTLRAFSTRNGDEVWTLELAPFTTFKASPVRVSDTSILVADISGIVYQVNVQEQEIEWTRDLGAPIYETPAVAGGEVAIATTRGATHLLNTATGSQRWVHQAPDHLRMGAPALNDRLVILGSTDGTVRALSRDSGKTVWETGFEDVISAAPLIAENAVFVGTLGEELAAMDLETGTVTWKTEVKGRIKSAMAVAGGGLLVLTEPKWVMYFKPANADAPRLSENSGGERP